jgi:hypothetical protein
MGSSPSSHRQTGERGLEASGSGGRLVPSFQIRQGLTQARRRLACIAYLGRPTLLRPRTDRWGRRGGHAREGSIVYDRSMCGDRAAAARQAKSPKSLKSSLLKGHLCGCSTSAECFVRPDTRSDHHACRKHAYLAERARLGAAVARYQIATQRQLPDNTSGETLQSANAKMNPGMGQDNHRTIRARKSRDGPRLKIALTSVWCSASSGVPSSPRGAPVVGKRRRAGLRMMRAACCPVLAAQHALRRPCLGR